MEKENHYYHSQYFITKDNWEKLTSEQKKLLKEKLPNLQIVSIEVLENIKKTQQVLVFTPAEHTHLQGLIDKPMCEVDNDILENRSWQREQMRERTRYMNKHYRNFKK